MLDDMEELTLQVIHFISFVWFRCKDCFEGFSVIKYTYVACLKVAIWSVFAVNGLIVFMVYWTIAYSGPCTIRFLFETLSILGFLRP